MSETSEEDCDYAVNDTLDAAATRWLATSNPTPKYLADALRAWRGQ